MKNLLLLSFVFFISVSVSSALNCIDRDSVKRIDFNEIRSEIEWFIKKVKPESIENGKYNVYLVKIYEEHKNQYCVTMGYIMDSLWASEISGFKYFTKVNDELVLLEYSNALRNKFCLEDKSIELLVDTKLVSDKIYPGIEFLGSPSGYVCCFEARNILKVYYDDADKIPDDKKIFKYIPQGTTIKMDSTSMKQMFKKKKKN